MEMANEIVPTEVLEIVVKFVVIIALKLVLETVLKVVSKVVLEVEMAIEITHSGDSSHFSGPGNEWPEKSPPNTSSWKYSLK